MTVVSNRSNSIKPDKLESLPQKKVLGLNSMTDKDLFSKSQYTVNNQKFGYGNGSYFKEILE